MNSLLLDIKNFLKKLENGQLDIEAGQWKLHKDIANMKRSVEELKKLKEDVEVMRINNAEQMGVIKNLEAKLEYFSKHLKDDDPATVSQCSTQYETVYRIPADGQQPSKGYKKRKCHLIRSEEIIEITSEISDKKSNTEEDCTSRDEGGPGNKQEHIDHTSEDISSPSLHKNHVHINPAPNASNVRYQSHPPNNAILQRYLKDSLKYRDRKMSSSTDRTGITSDSSACGHKEAEHNNFWDDYSWRSPQNQGYGARVQNQGYGARVQNHGHEGRAQNHGHEGRAQNQGHESRAQNQGHEGRAQNQGHESRAQNQGHEGRAQNQGHEGRAQNPMRNSSESSRTTESVIPKRLICPKNAKRFTFKSDFPEQEKRNGTVRHIYQCKICGKGFSKRNMLRAHKLNHEGVSRRARGFKCSYCDKVCGTPENLTMHLRNCRIVMRSHFRRR